VSWKPGLTLRFTLDGEVLDVPAGTLIAVEPHVHREAVAIDPDTAVLAFGGPPTFQPAGHEYMAGVGGALDRPQEAQIDRLLGG
jgi:hypothetical protein